MYKYEIQNNNNNLHPSDNLMFLIFHVDDILLSVHPSHRNYADSFKTAFMHRFDARDEGPVTRYVGVDIHRVKDRIYLTQAGRHDWFYYTSTKCAIPDDMAGQQRFWGALVTSAQH